MLAYYSSLGTFAFKHPVKIADEKVSSVLVRPYAIDELEEVCEVFTYSNPGMTSQQIMKWTLPVTIEHCCHYQFVAEYKGRIVGAVSGKVRDKRRNVHGYIDDIAVDKEVIGNEFPELKTAMHNGGHRVSIGSLLLNDVIHAFLYDRLPGVELDVYEDNVNAQRFYDEHGFYVKRDWTVGPEEAQEGFIEGARTYTLRRELFSSVDAAERYRKYHGIR